MLTERNRGPDFCPRCGCEVRWARLFSGRWISTDPEPVLYLPEQGRQTLVTPRRWDADLIRDCKIWRPGMLTEGIRRAYMPHKFSCEGRRA